MGSQLLFTEYKPRMKGFCLMSCLLLTLSLAVRPDVGNIEGHNENRKGRLFFVATSILSSTTQCYATDATLTACAARRKRKLILEAEETDNTEDIRPISSDPHRREEDLHSGLEELEEGS